jgi:FAD/FMN-containing dehydrogenase/Fe-S oxidoreductase
MTTTEAPRTPVPATSAPAAGSTRPAGGLAATLAGAMRGEVAFDASTRAVFATDSSNYRHVPLGVVYPVDHDDVVCALRVCAEFDVPVVARGTGTSLAGQACNVAVVVDTSRHMTRIVEIDPVARTARVQPGVILDDLRRAAEEHGLTFGPDPATHAWCTIGGMIGNNACGSHALFAGKTVDNVDRLRVVLYGGDTIDVGSFDEAALAEAIDRGDRLSGVLAGLRRISDGHAALVRARFPSIPRRVSGYNLDELLPEHGFNVARALVGTESTCGIVTEATLSLTVSPRHRRLVVVGYPDLFAAADAVPLLLRSPLLALEGFDGALAARMREQTLNVEHLPLLPDGGAWLLAELGSNDPGEADRLADEFIAGLPADVTSRRFDDPGQQARVWLIRESGLGAAARRADGSRNHEGWEDAAVEPAHLGAYLRAITALWDEFGYSGIWYGHFGQACVHTRNNFDFSTPEGVARFRQYIERAADLVVSLGGSLSGEHGDGQARSELLERMYGPDLVEAFREFKSAFDPRGRMNPGIIVDPRRLDADLHFGPGYRRSTLGRSTFTFGVDGRSLQKAAERCVGVGKCRRDDAGTMCPSFRVTRDERHSTRGRAKLLVEMSQGEVTPLTWRNREVRDALDLCLSCKGCATDCPTHVDMASFKSEYLHHYYRGRLRPRVMYVLGLLPWAARAVSRVPWLPNAVLGAPVLGRLVLRAAGLTTERPAPRFAPRPFRRSPVAQAHRDLADATVVVWPDTFTDAFRPGPGADLVAVLEAFGERVAVPSKWACCGRPLYDAGMLGQARRSLRHVLDVLDPWTSRDTPVVVLEPTCLATFRDELPALLPDDPRSAALASLARSPAEHLLASTAFNEAVAARREGRGLTVRPRAVVHPHCHGRAVGAPASDRAVLERLGLAASVLDAGCCGLAGSFGYRAEHEHLSRRIGTEQWLPKVRAAIGDADDTTLVVDGYGCEMQLHHLSDLESTPLITLVRQALGC